MSKDESLASALIECFTSVGAMNESTNVVDALATGLRAVSRAIHKLGVADAFTPMGAIEAHAVAVKEAGASIERGLSDIADALRELAQREHS
jgi:hypothetical protein